MKQKFILSLVTMTALSSVSFAEGIQCEDYDFGSGQRLVKIVTKNNSALIQMRVQLGGIEMSETLAQILGLANDVTMYAFELHIPQPRINRSTHDPVLVESTSPGAGSVLTATIETPRGPETVSVSLDTARFRLSRTYSAVSGSSIVDLTLGRKVGQAALQASIETNFYESNDVVSCKMIQP